MGVGSKKTGIVILQKGGDKVKDYFRGETADRLFEELGVEERNTLHHTQCVESVENALDVPERNVGKPHGRLIDADALIKRATTYTNDNEGWSCTPQADADFVEYVNKQPTVTMDKWIPCSERLPRIGTPVLVTIVSSEYGIDIDEMVSFGGGDAEWLDHWGDDVIAWMPLPEPYKE